LHFEISAKFYDDDFNYQKAQSCPISHDSTLKGNVLPSMLGFEKLKDMFLESSYDTSAIVKLAMEYNLLCDYTALIALEPNDTLHFMKNPFEEDKLVFVDFENDNNQDSLIFDIYPNPFNSQTTISLNIPYPSLITIYIYNICGQLVKEIDQTNTAIGMNCLAWDGTNTSFQNVSSGLYFVRVAIINNQKKTVINKMKKILLIR